MENTLTLTPSTLVSMANEEYQVLKHSSQWVETIAPLVAAMQAMIQSNKKESTKFFQTLAANFTDPRSRVMLTETSDHLAGIAMVATPIQTGYLPLPMTSVSLGPFEAANGTIVQIVVIMEDGFAPILMRFIIIPIKEKWQMMTFIIVNNTTTDCILS
jgi:hypothetical protein